jgi:hypothetical protein
MSEYIPRLRQELVDAAARERDGQRRRLGVRPARVALVLAAAVVDDFHRNYVPFSLPPTDHEGFSDAAEDSEDNAPEAGHC